MLSEKATCNNQKTITPHSFIFSVLLEYRIVMERGSFLFMKLSVFLCSVAYVKCQLTFPSVILSYRFAYYTLQTVGTRICAFWLTNVH